MTSKFITLTIAGMLLALAGCWEPTYDEPYYDRGVIIEHDGWNRGYDHDGWGHYGGGAYGGHRDFDRGGHATEHGGHAGSHRGKR